MIHMSIPMYIQTLVWFRPPVLKTPPKSSPPSDGGRMDRGKWPSRRTFSERNATGEKRRWTFNVGRLQVAVFFGLNSWKQRNTNWIQFKKRWIGFECWDLAWFWRPKKEECRILHNCWLSPPQVYQGTPTHIAVNRQQQMYQLKQLIQ